MAKYLTLPQWDQYVQILNDFNGDTAQADLIWFKSIGFIPKTGSDDNPKLYEDPYTLKVLVQDNAFRTWPITQYTEVGEKDKQSIFVYMNIDYLRANNLLDANDNFAYSPENDKFVYRGKTYYDAGDTPSAQAYDRSILFLMVLKRVDVDPDNG